MKTTTKIVFASALAVSVAAPAFADCQADIKTAEEAAAKITDAKQQAEAQKHLDAAKSELAKANEKACSQHVAEANKSLKPTMKTP